MYAGSSTVSLASPMSSDALVMCTTAAKRCDRAGVKMPMAVWGRRAGAHIPRKHMGFVYIGNP